MSRKETIKKRQNRNKELLLEQMKRTPTIEQACQKVGVSRQTVWLWRKDDPKFEKAVEEALREGRAFMADLAEAQLFGLVGERNMSAIRFFLSHNSPRYGNKVEIVGDITHRNKDLSSKQKKVIEEALRLVAFNKEKYLDEFKKKNKNGETDTENN